MPWLSPGKAGKTGQRLPGLSPGKQARCPGKELACRGSLIGRLELGIAGAGGAVDVARRQEALALDEPMAPGAAAGPAGGSLEVVESGLDRRGVGGFDLGGDGMAAERPGKRNGLRRREGQVEAGDGAALDVAKPERLARRGIVAGQHPDELGGLDLALEAEILGGVAEPIALGLRLA
jgi:hypothetical protein